MNCGRRRSRRPHDAGTDAKSVLFSFQSSASPAGERMDLPQRQLTFGMLMQAVGRALLLGFILLLLLSSPSISTIPVLAQISLLPRWLVIGVAMAAQVFEHTLRLRRHPPAAKRRINRPHNQMTPTTVLNVALRAFVLGYIMVLILSSRRFQQIPILSRLSQLPDFLVLGVAMSVQVISHLRLLRRRAAAAELEFIRMCQASRQCGNCGYDLRGSPGPHCPECGEEIAPFGGPSSTD